MFHNLKAFYVLFWISLVSSRDYDVWQKAVVRKQRITKDEGGKYTEIERISFPYQSPITYVSQRNRKFFLFSNHLFQLKFLCSMECNKRDFCEAWCLQDLECFVTNFLISPQDGPQDDDHMTCFTNRQGNNLILKATATSSAAAKPASLLTKGIYNYDYRTTLMKLSSGFNPYMVFEFDQEVLVKTIRIKNPIATNTVPSTQTEIRIGTSMPGGPTDFSQLDLIGNMNNFEPLEWNIFTIDPARKIKFLAIFEKDKSHLALTFMEVFQN